MTNSQRTFDASVLFEQTTHHLSFYKNVFLTHRIFFFSSLSFVTYSSSDSFISASIKSSVIDTFSTPIIMTYQLIDFTFVFCDIFFDQNNISASRWLKKFEHEMSDYKTIATDAISADKYFESMSMLLIDDAANWFENHFDAIRLLNDSVSIQFTIISFKSLLCERFSSKIVEITFVSFDVKLIELRQRDDESLVDYYKRIINLMQRINAKNKSAFVVTITLILFEFAMLNIILRAFIKDLLNSEIRKKTTKDMISSNRSLRTIYQLAEKTRRINIEIKKLFDEKLKYDELSFYKNLTQRNLFRHQIKILLTKYHAVKLQTQKQEFQWLIYENLNTATASTQFQISMMNTSLSISVASRQFLIVNFNKINETSRFSQSTRKQTDKYQFTVKNLSDRIIFKNSYINDIKLWFMNKNDRLCIKCDHLNHIFKKCNDDVLSSWKQSYLREIMFDQSTQMNFAQIDFGNFDDNVRFYDNYFIFDFSITFFDKTISFTSTVLMNDALDNSTSHSIHVEIADLFMRLHVDDVNAVDAFYDEKFAINKRSHVEKSIESKKSTFNQFESTIFLLSSQQFFTQSIADQQFQFQTADLKSKKNKKNQERKKFESQSIIDILDDASSKYDSTISIRQIFQNNKIDLIWMNLIAWFLTVCRKFKRFCTRVIKKREFKKIADQQSAQQFNPMISQYISQSISAYQMFASQIFQQTSQSIQQTYVSISSIQFDQSQSSQMFSQSVSQQSFDTIFNVTTSQQDVERHTRFLNAMIKLDKIFKISCTIIKSNDTIVLLSNRCTQTNQNFDMNVIFVDMIRHLNLQLHSLEKIDFKSLFMRTVDHKKIILHHYVWLRVNIEKIVRNIRCFVASKLSQIMIFDETKHLSLILKLFWLYFVNVLIFIRQSKIMIDDVNQSKTIKVVVESKLVFCNDHNLLMYSKSVMTAFSNKQRRHLQSKIEKISSFDSFDSNDSDEKNDLFDIENSIQSFFSMQLFH